MAEFVRRVALPVPADAAFQWHARPGAFERLTPPWAPVEVEERTGGIESGARVVLRMPAGPLRVRWVAEYRDYQPGRRFRDVQISGPFAEWDHAHGFMPDGPDRCVLEDRIRFRPPLGLVGAPGIPLIRRMLARMFAYRHRITAGDLAAHAAASGPPLHVLVSGASGLVGSALVPFLTTGGHRVTRLVRNGRGAADTRRWDPASGRLDPEALDGVDAVVHLAGENIAGGRWTAARKARIRESRVQGTRLLAEALAQHPRPPTVLVCASAVGYYGDRGDDRLDEAAEPGTGFLADVCRAWEAAADPARAAGVRVVQLRTGMVLTSSGGALARMLPPFRLGVGGRLGHGRQWMSWIALDDLLGVILHAVHRADLSGPINAVAPSPVTNATLTQTLAAVLHRPAWLPVPASALRLGLGEMAQELLLASTRATPARLAESGYPFRFPALDDALRHTLGRA